MKIIVVTCLGSMSAFSKLGIHVVALTEQIFHAYYISIIVFFVCDFSNVEDVLDSLKKKGNVVKHWVFR